jgi:hypothetical protein
MILWFCLDMQLNELKPTKTLARASDRSQALIKVCFENIFKLANMNDMMKSALK